MKRSILFTAAIVGGSLLAGAVGLAPNGASAQQVECKLPNENANPIAFFSANTDNGIGNGGERAVIVENIPTGNISYLCDTPDAPDGQDRDSDAFDPAVSVSPGGSVVRTRANDPGNSGDNSPD